MKRIDECTDMTVLVALLVLGILLVMGAYRIFSFLCEHAALDARTFLLGAACLLLAVVGFPRRSVSYAPPQSVTVTSRPNSSGRNRGHTLPLVQMVEAASRVPISQDSASVLP